MDGNPITILSRETLYRGVARGVIHYFAKQRNIKHARTHTYKRTKKHIHTHKHIAHP